MITRWRRITDPSIVVEIVSHTFGNVEYRRPDGRCVITTARQFTALYEPEDHTWNPLVASSS